VTELEALGAVSAVKHFRPYLYGHSCHLYTDHEALKVLLNTPHPSGKLARWGLALQEVDIHIHYRPGKKNANADALSRYPLSIKTSQNDQSNVFGIVSAISVLQFQAKDGETNLSTQREDPELLEVITFLVEGTLPKDERKAKELALTQTQYEIVVMSSTMLRPIQPFLLFHQDKIVNHCFMKHMMEPLVPI